MKPYVFTLWSLFFAIPMSAQDQADSTVVFQKVCLEEILKKDQPKF